MKSAATSASGTARSPSASRGRRRRSSLGMTASEAPTKNDQRHPPASFRVNNNEPTKNVHNDSMAKLIDMLQHSGMDLSFLPGLPKTYERLRQNPASLDESLTQTSSAALAAQMNGEDGPASGSAWLEQEVSRLRAQVQGLEEERTNLLNDMQAENRALLQVLHAAHESREQMNRELAQFLAERDALLAQHLEQQAGDFDRSMEDTSLAQELLQPVPRQGAQELQALLVRLATRIRACQRDVLVKVVEEVRGAGELFLSGQDPGARLRALQHLADTSAAACLPPASPRRAALLDPSPRGSDGFASPAMSPGTPTRRLAAAHPSSPLTKELPALAHSRFLATQGGLGQTGAFLSLTADRDQEGLALVLRAERAEAEARTLREANVLLEAHLTRLRHTTTVASSDSPAADPHRTLRSSSPVASESRKTETVTVSATTLTLVDGEEGKQEPGPEPAGRADGGQPRRQEAGEEEQEEGGDPLEKLPVVWRDTAARMVRAYLRKFVEMSPLTEALRGEGREQARAAVVDALLEEVLPAYVDLLLLFVGSEYVAKATAGGQQPQQPGEDKAVMRDVCGQVLASPAVDNEVTALVAMYMRYLHGRAPALLVARQTTELGTDRGHSYTSSPRRG